MEANERDLYLAAIRGDRAAFEMIIRQQSRALFAIAYGVLQNREEAEDAVQDSLVKAWKSRWRVRDPEKFPAWLSAITRHRAHDVFRKRQRDKTTPEMEGHAPPASEVFSESHLLLPPIDRKDIDQQLRSALATLPELHRSALTLRYFEEMDYASIENLLGLSNGALRGILGRALATLRKELKPVLASHD